MKRSSKLLLAYIAALRAEGADLPESDHETINTLSDALDSWTGDPVNYPDMERSIQALWISANETYNPDWTPAP